MEHLANNQELAMVKDTEQLEIADIQLLKEQIVNIKFKEEIIDIKVSIKEEFKDNKDKVHKEALHIDTLVANKEVN